MQNSCILVGDIVLIGEPRSFQNDTKVLDFTLRTWSTDPAGRTRFEYHPIQVWGPAIDKAKPHLVEGKLIRIDGVISHSSWEDAYGQRRWKTVIRGLIIRPVSLDIPPMNQAERDKFLPRKKKLQPVPQ